MSSDIGDDAPIRAHVTTTVDVPARSLTTVGALARMRVGEYGTRGVPAAPFGERPDAAGV